MMSGVYKHLYVFVEGWYDENFFEAVIKPLLEDDFLIIQFIQYSGMKIEKVKNFLKSIDSNPAADYFFVIDFDDFPCFTSIKTRLSEKYGRCLDVGKVLVVQKEIESWYCAGINLLRFNIQLPQSTNGVSKEQFYKLLALDFDDSLIAIMTDILKEYNIAQARERNHSFDYVLLKLGI